MKRFFALLIMLTSGFASLSAQGDYMVSTNSTSSLSSADSPEQQFVNANFPHQQLCDWTPGMKFMCLPERKDILIPVFKTTAGKEIDTGKLRYKIFEYLGYENVGIGVHINFECEGVQYYHEVKNSTFEEYCLKPKGGIPSLAYLADVDMAKELLTGQTLYLKTDRVDVDDASATTGFREVNVTRNTKVTVTAVGVFSRAFPVKVVFQDVKGNTYFLPLALSKTNCGMIDSDFSKVNNADNRTFTTAFTFGDANVTKSTTLMSQYGHKYVYLKNETSLTDKNGNSVKKARYSQFKVKNIVSANGTPYVTLQLADSEGNLYEARTTFTHTDVAKSLLQTEDYFGDLFGVGDLRAKYPYITEGAWDAISRGEVRKGMTRDECRLALGDPLRIQRVNGQYETWYYERKILDFTDKKLERVQ